MPDVATSPNDTSRSETKQSAVTNISEYGFWLLIADREYFVSFEQYPFFLHATVAQVYNVKQLGRDQFHWPDLDIDVDLAALEALERFPLLFQE